MPQNSKTPEGIAARAAAQRILNDVLRKHRPLDAAQDAVLEDSGLSPRDAGFARAIAGETLRRFGQIDAVIRAFVSKPPPPHRSGPTLDILMTGICELLFLNVAPHAAVDAANWLAAADNKAVHFKPLVNAVLRRTVKDGASVIAGKDAARLNTPDWLWERWSAVYGSDVARRIADAHSTQPPTDFVLRDNAATAPDGAIQLAGNVYRRAETGRIDLLNGFAQGHWWVQDFAATLPVRLLGDVRGRRVIDLCAAPGGKTMQLAAMGANVVAVEKDAARLARVQQNLARLRFSAELIESDLRDYAPQELAPFVLLDAPCSATGTIRRHPELPWLREQGDILRNAQAGFEYLQAAADMVAPGGTLVFAVCSLEPEEGVEQVENFLADRSDFVRKPVKPADVLGMSALIADGDLRTLPCHLAERGGMDGFYAARLVRL